MSAVSHVAVLAFPFGTHAAPLLSLARRFAASSPDVIFSFFSTAASNSAVCSGAEAAGVRFYHVRDGLPDGYVFSRNHLEPVEYFLKAAAGNFEEAMSEAEVGSGVKISCLLTDAFLWFSADLAEKKGLPWIAFWTSASSSLSMHLCTDEIRSAVATTDDATKAERTLEFIPGLSAITFSDLPDEVLKDDSESIFAFTLHNMALKLPKATAVVLNSFEEIDPTITNHLKSSMFRNFLNVGPLLTLPTSTSSTPDKEECLKWLETQEHASVAYISFGTVTSPPPHEMAALAEALESRKTPFLWSLRDESRKHLPEGFLDRTSSYGKFVSWAPQLQILANPSVGVFVTHCGWNSILESITCGVPMICRPFFGDQKPNSRMVEAVWKIGIRIEGGTFTQDGTIHALEAILYTDKGRDMRENVGRLKGKALDAIKPTGSSAKNFETLAHFLKAPDLLPLP